MALTWSYWKIGWMADDFPPYTSWNGVQGCVPGGELFLASFLSPVKYRALGTESISCSSVIQAGSGTWLCINELQNGRWAGFTHEDASRFEDHDLKECLGKIEEILALWVKGPELVYLFIHFLFNHVLFTCPTNAYPELLCAGTAGWKDE